MSLYKILSPTHLLKLPAATDSNKLNPKFYAKLLHLIGLEEIKEGGRKVIRRKEAANPAAVCFELR
ncbi:type IIG restriction enzyme/methyltransferase [Spirosoma validum]